MLVRDDAQKTERFAQITVTNASTSLAALINTALTVTDGIKLARVALFMVEGAGTAIRFTSDGSTPTATKGIRMLTDTWYTFSGDLSAMLLIREGGANVLVNVELYR